MKPIVHCLRWLRFNGDARAAILTRGLFVTARQELLANQPRLKWLT